MVNVVIGSGIGARTSGAFSGMIPQPFDLSVVAPDGSGSGDGLSGFVPFPEVGATL